MTSEKDQEQFKEWAENNLPIDEKGEPYCADLTDPFEIWQAAIASMPRVTEEDVLAASRLYLDHARETDPLAKVDMSAIRVILARWPHLKGE